MNSADGQGEVEALLFEIGDLRGGSEKLYKPVVAIELYEHDLVATVRVGRCKSLDEVVHVTRATGEHACSVALSNMLLWLRATGAE